MNEIDIRKSLSHFTIVERGKKRYISAPKFSERIIQKSIAQNALIPAIEPTLTTGCAANIKGRGTDYCLIRLKQQLADFYKKHGNNGYILLLDFSNFFGNISHNQAKLLVNKVLTDKQLKKLVYLQIDSNGEIGLGLGSEPNQAIAVALPSPLDRLGERWPGILYSGRYMDDSYFIATDKETLHNFLDEAYAVCSTLGITINEKKTHIIKLSRSFTFLKKVFRYSPTGKIIITPSRKSIKRMKRKMRKLAALVYDERMTFEQAQLSYLSFRGSLCRKKGDKKPRFRMNSYQTVRSLDKMFYELYKDYL